MAFPSPMPDKPRPLLGALVIPRHWAPVTPVNGCVSVSCLTTLSGSHVSAEYGYGWHQALPSHSWAPEWRGGCWGGPETPLRTAGSQGLSPWPRPQAPLELQSPRGGLNRKPLGPWCVHATDVCGACCMPGWALSAGSSGVHRTEDTPQS